jgi:hypothetical protein
MVDFTYKQTILKSLDAEHYDLKGAKFEISATRLHASVLD